MANTKKVIYSGREFVNNPGQDDTGYIQAHIKWEYNYGFGDWDNEDYDENDVSKDGSPGHIDYMLKFADCTRIIDFNINGSNEEEQKNSIAKVDKMIEVLTGFRKALDEAFIAEVHIANTRKERKNKALKELNKQNEEGEETTSG